MGAQPSIRLEGRIPKGWLPLSHAEALQSLPQVRLAALCDSASDVVSRWAKHYGVEATFTDYRDLLKKARPDLLTVATRTPMKREILEAAFSSGVRGVYVEKPLARSMAEVDSILAAAAGSGTVVTYGVNRRYHAAYRLAKARLESGDIGELTDIVVQHGHAPLFWSHPHSTDLMLFFAPQKEVDTVQANLSSVNQISDFIVDSDPLVDQAFFRFKGGVTGHIVRGGGLNLILSGTRGTLTVFADGSEVVLKQAGETGYQLEEKRWVSEHSEGATVTALRELTLSIQTGAAPPIETSEIRLGMAMLLACVWSHLNGGRSTPIGEVPPNLEVSGRTGELFA